MFKWTYKTQRKLVIVSFLFVPLLLLGTFSLYPAGFLVYLSFVSWDGMLGDKKWVGLSNYREVIMNKEIFAVFSHNLAYLLVATVQNFIGLFLAILLNTRLRGRNFYRVILFSPFILNGVAVAFMFNYVYHVEYGSLNNMLKFIGLQTLGETNWLGNVNLVNYTLASIGLWKFMGFNLVIYLAALQSIPTSILEAARIDGAGSWRTIWSITLPNIIRIIELNCFLVVVGALEVFDLPFVLTKGGPVGASETFVLKTIDMAFKFSKFGLASAMSVTLVVIVAAVLIAQRLSFKKWGHGDT